MPVNLLERVDRELRACEKEAMRVCHLDPNINYHERVRLEWQTKLDRIKFIAPFYNDMEDALREVGILKTEDNKLSKKYAMITLRPEEGICKFHTFKYDCEKFFKKSLFINYELAYEQIGTTVDDTGKGFHCHAIVCVKDYVNVKDIITAYKFIPYNCIIQIGSKSGTKFIRTERDLSYARNYIRGDKHNKEKEASVAMDKVWRKTVELEDIYTSSNQDR